MTDSLEIASNEQRDGRSLATGTSGEADLDRKIIRGSVWTAVSYGGGKVLSLVSALVLVRLVDPKAFGLMAVAWATIQVIYAVQESGMAAAFVFRRSDVEHAAASVLVVSLLGGAVLYAGFFAVSPLIASLFHAPELEGVLHVFSLVILFRALAVVPGAILERELNFRGRARAEVAGAVVQAGVAIGLAAAGFGVWSLVAGAVSSAGVIAAICWSIISWRPDPRLASLSMIRQLVRYGRFVTASNLLVLVNNTVDNLIIGRLLGATQLGFYSVTFRVATMPNDMIVMIVGRVMFSVYSRLQDDMASFRRVYVQTLQRVALLSLPIAVGAVIAAKPIVLGLLGEHWRGVITPLRLLSLYALFRMFASPSGEAFKGLGRPHLRMVTGAIHLSLAVPALLLLIPRYGLSGAAAGMLVSMAIVCVIVLVMTSRLLALDFRELARALAPSFACAALLGLAVWLLLPVVRTLPPVPALVVIVCAALAVYVASTAVLARAVIVPIWAGLRRA